MKPTIDVFWSFRSPYSYLVTPDLIRLREDYEVELKLRPVLPIALRTKDTLFTPDNPNKVNYILLDVVRRAEYLGMSIAMPTPDPIVQDLTTFEVAAEQPYIYRLTALGIEAERQGKGIDLAYAVSHLIWGSGKNWDQGDQLAKAVASAGLDLQQLEAAIEHYDPNTDIEKNHKMLDDAGHWGVPTMAFNNEPFYGQDRINTLRWRLDQAGLKR
ncbi:MAG: disulfide bond formation protein DsbA [Cellvibrionaceae bacterium]|nr:disulfide bond formation protein DsbA [Cellvibrionaceae bacterium]|tara:strand:- start:29171 stop:29812 length:642 start_codon:yes stop_codon:yes gene_type:complete